LTILTKHLKIYVVYVIIQSISVKFIMSIGNKENGFKIKKTGEGGISYVYQISEDTVAKLTPISEKVKTH